MWGGSSEDARCATSSFLTLPADSIGFYEGGGSNAQLLGSRAGFIAMGRVRRGIAMPSAARLSVVPYVAPAFLSPARRRSWVREAAARSTASASMFRCGVKVSCSARAVVWEKAQSMEAPKSPWSVRQNVPPSSSLSTPPPRSKRSLHTSRCCIAPIRPSSARLAS